MCACTTGTGSAARLVGSYSLTTMRRQLPMRRCPGSCVVRCCTIGTWKNFVVLCMSCCIVLVFRMLLAVAGHRCVVIVLFVWLNESAWQLVAWCGATRCIRAAGNSVCRRLEKSFKLCREGTVSVAVVGCCRGVGGRASNKAAGTTLHAQVAVCASALTMLDSYTAR
jgi:hypothetical protein